MNAGPTLIRACSPLRESQSQVNGRKASCSTSPATAVMAALARPERRLPPRPRRVLRAGDVRRAAQVRRASPGHRGKIGGQGAILHLMALPLGAGRGHRVRRRRTCLDSLIRAEIAANRIPGPCGGVSAAASWRGTGEYGFARLRTVSRLPTRTVFDLRLGLQDRDRGDADAAVRARRDRPG